MEKKKHLKKPAGFLCQRRNFTKICIQILKKKQNKKKLIIYLNDGGNKSYHTTESQEFNHCSPPWRRGGWGISTVCMMMERIFRDRTRKILSLSF